MVSVIGCKMPDSEGDVVYRSGKGGVPTEEQTCDLLFVPHSSPLSHRATTWAREKCSHLKEAKKPRPGWGKSEERGS